MGYSHALPKIVSSIPRNSNPLDLFINTGVGLVLGSSTVRFCRHGCQVGSGARSISVEGLCKIRIKSRYNFKYWTVRIYD